MYLSCLLVNVGDNPDRPRPGRIWLRNRYHVHQRLAMAFPCDGRIKTASDYVKPYNPAEFPFQTPADDVMNGKADIHEERTDGRGFLYRVDQRVGPGASATMILVQSAKPPDWNYAFGLSPDATDPATGRPVGNAGCLLADQPKFRCLNLRLDGEQGNGGAPPATPGDVEPVTITLSEGETLAFRLSANPTRRLASGPFAGSRVAIGGGAPAILAWLSQKGTDGGFEIVFEKGDDGCDPNWRIATAMLHAWKGTQDENAGKKISLFYANIDGRLKITNPARFRETIVKGIGPAKAFGFGLLSLARLPA
jgi:hypothetical protein